MNLTYLPMYLITHLCAACSMHCTYLPHPIKLSIPTSSEPEKEKREKKEKERKKANDLTDEIIHIHLPLTRG